MVEEHFTAKRGDLAESNKAVDRAVLPCANPILSHSRFRDREPLAMTSLERGPDPDSGIAGDFKRPATGSGEVPEDWF